MTQSIAGTDAIRKAVVDRVIPELKLNGSYNATVSTVAINLSRQISIPGDDPFIRSKNLKAYLEQIKKYVKTNNIPEEGLFKSLSEEVDQCHKLPTSSAGGWHNPDDVFRNNCYIAEFVQVLGAIAEAPQEFFVKEL